MKRSSYSTLWGYGEKRATADFSPFKTDDEARAFRDALYYAMKKRGVKVRRSTLKGQMRQYWGWGSLCGHVCNVYELEYGAS
jgi:hypothetical protein